MAATRTEFEAADKRYSNAMEIWSEKESILVEEVLKSREDLKGKMKKDWTTVNEHNTSIQATTRSVHEETVRIVDAQMKEMALQMQALDQFVTRARSQNESHHASHITSLHGLSSAVEESHSTMHDHLHSTRTRLETHEVAMTDHNKTLINTLPPLDSTVRRPLSELRGTILGMPLTEYEPTGETPQKVQYQYPTLLPKTEARDKLLINHTPRLTTEEYAEDLDVSMSPSKSAVYTDAPDEDVALVRPTSSDGGLREINVNVNAAMPRNIENLTFTKPEIETLHFSSSLMGPPPLKRHATLESKLPQKFAGGRSGVFRLEGRENVPVGAGRRLRSSPPS